MMKINDVLLYLAKYANEKSTSKYSCLHIGDIKALLNPDSSTVTNLFETDKFTIFIDTNDMFVDSFINNSGFKIGNTYTLNFGILSKRVDENELNLANTDSINNHDVESFYNEKLMELTNIIQCGFDYLKFTDEMSREIIELNFDNFEFDEEVFEINQWLYYKCNMEIVKIK